MKDSRERDGPTCCQQNSTEGDSFEMVGKLNERLAVPMRLSWSHESRSVEIPRWTPLSLIVATECSAGPVVLPLWCLLGSSFRCCTGSNYRWNLFCTHSHRGRHKRRW
jgi:hypothetical protein